MQTGRMGESEIKPRGRNNRQGRRSRKSIKYDRKLEEGGEAFNLVPCSGGGRRNQREGGKGNASRWGGTE